MWLHYSLIVNSVVPETYCWSPRPCFVASSVLNQVIVLVVCTGIGQGRVTNNVKGAPIDYAHLILDTEAVAMVIL